MEYTGMKNVLKEFFKRLKTYLSSNYFTKNQVSTTYETISNVDLIENVGSLLHSSKGIIPSV